MNALNGLINACMCLSLILLAAVDTLILGLTPEEQESDDW